MPFTSGDTIAVAALPAVLQQDDTPVMGLEHIYAHLSLQEARETFEQGYIKEVLTKAGGNITRN